MRSSPKHGRLGERAASASADAPQTVSNGTVMAAATHTRTGHAIKARVEREVDVVIFGIRDVQLLAHAFQAGLGKARTQCQCHAANEAVHHPHARTGAHGQWRCACGVEFHIHNTVEPAPATPLVGAHEITTRHCCAPLSQRRNAAERVARYAPLLWT